MARFRLDSPLAKLDLPRVPLLPVVAVPRIGLDADDQADGGAVDVSG